MWPLAIAFFLSLLVACGLTPVLAKYARGIGLTRVDCHKAEPRPQVPLLGGVSILVAAFSGLAVEFLLYPQYRFEIAVHAAAVLMAFVVGIVDDLFILGGPTKTALTALPLLPIVLGWGLFEGRIVLGKPLVPILGSLRITIIYWLLLPLAIAGPANLVNMLDIMNGIMPGTMLIAFASLLSSAVLLNIEKGIILTVPWIGALCGYLPYNSYPASIFNGDAGSLTVGASLASIAVLTRMEFMALVALLPHLLNGFLVVSSVGFKEHRKHKERPIEVAPDGSLKPNLSPSAPMSLTRLLLASAGTMRENEVVICYILGEFVAAILTIVSALLVK